MDARDAARLAGRIGGTALKAKLIGIASVVFVLFLLVVGLFGAGIGGKAMADSCGDAGLPGVDTGGTGPGGGQGPPAKLREEQLANAKIIDTVAIEGRLSGRATLVALMTALQESTLINRRDGHLDSVGLFQQRPSAGWGTVEQIMDPEYSSRMFFFGGDDGSPRGLTDISGWALMEPGNAAQAVQVSAHPELYAGHEVTARQIADQAGIDLARTGSLTNPEDENDAIDNLPGDVVDDGPQGPEDCYPGSTAPGGTPGQPGEPFHDGEAAWPVQVKNPRSTADAIAWARQEARTGGRDWYRLCLAFVARTYGWSYSGVNYAIDHYKQMPANMKNDLARNPPPGALMYWDTGQRAGHVAIYLGNGEIASNDIKRPGYIDVVPATDIESKWGAKYLGWAPPYFPKGG
ncbi:NlpC/P60 family protein [Streptomyces tsukubensis]|uniref:NlpC/P60 family protein n=1 Tax=Streptomyces tsukubensis TaxID=83656 RepID=UPI00344F107B